MQGSNRVESLFSHLTNSFERFKDRPALFVDDRVYSYGELEGYAAKISQSIIDSCNQTDEFVSVYAHRSMTTYAGVIGVLAAGKAYTPLHPNFPMDRTLAMFNRSGSKTIIVGQESVDLLPRFLKKVDQKITLIGPEIEDWGNLPSEFPGHRFVNKSQFPESNKFEIIKTAPSLYAYLLFTSGSTGEPKGIVISHENVSTYVDHILARYNVTEEDKLSNTFDLTFDLSVHDMFVAWTAGACLHVIPEAALFAPGRFIKKHELTMWFSVPSMANMMARLRMLKPGAFPSLRCSLFCGEALSAGTAAVWQDAAPNSMVENLYGPTEATIAFTGYRWEKGQSDQVCINGIVPIGRPFPNHLAEVITANGEVSKAEEEGELCLCGPQVAGGYFNDIDKTKKSFVRFSKLNREIWYKTGDLAKKDENGVIYYLGRLDNQVQVRGYRVELQEVEHAISQFLDDSSIICIAWPIVDGAASDIHAFIAGMPDSVSMEDIKRHCACSLPDYMIPASFQLIDQFPLNPNGKIDRLALAEILSTKNART